ncbi:MAG: hypothetical protein MJ193_05190, partial [Clostridia bacterium]|nr:hypothetical protein [Clostridia bacterium]
ELFAAQSEKYIFVTEEDNFVEYNEGTEDDVTEDGADVADDGDKVIEEAQKTFPKWIKPQQK